MNCECCAKNEHCHELNTYCQHTAHVETDNGKWTLRCSCYLSTSGITITVPAYPQPYFYPSPIIEIAPEPIYQYPSTTG